MNQGMHRYAGLSMFIIKQVWFEKQADISVNKSVIPVRSYWANGSWRFKKETNHILKTSFTKRIIVVYILGVSVCVCVQFFFI